MKLLSFLTTFLALSALCSCDIRYTNTEVKHFVPGDTVFCQQLGIPQFALITTNDTIHSIICYDYSTKKMHLQFGTTSWCESYDDFRIIYWGE